MRDIKLRLNSMEKVKRFFDNIVGMKGNYDIEQARRYIDAKSLLGIFSLDLDRPLTLKIHDDEQYYHIMSEFKDLAA